MPCCTQAITRGGFGIESYVEALQKQDPAVMSCIQAADDAADRRKLLMVAGAAGAVVLGALAFKKLGKKKKR